MEIHLNTMFQSIKIKYFIVLLCSICSTINLNAQDLRLFDLSFYQKNKNESIGFISLSDVYPLNENRDSLAMPDLNDKKNDTAKYIKLNNIYRKTFFSKTRVSERDTVFIYNYSLNVLLSYPVNILNVVACLDVYTVDRPYSQQDYMIGFEVNKKFINGFSEDFSTTLVYVGKNNPFIRGQIKRINWKKIKKEDFPAKAVNYKDISGLNEYLQGGKFFIGNSYKYEQGDLEYYLQELISLNDGQIFFKQLIVLSLKTKNTVFKKNYLSNESASFAPLNEQWTGKIFKNKPSVIFGFHDMAFGCPNITVLDTKEKGIDINCDNRH